MFIKVKCSKCEWKGYAEVGRRKGGVPLSDQMCPKCGSNIKRDKGSYIWGSEKAKLKKISRI